jgi:hypothetical protein
VRGNSALEWFGAAMISPVRLACMGLFIVCISLQNLTAAPASPEKELSSPRDFYNDGTKKLKEGKLREAETSLQTAVASQDEKIQPAALYNLGEVRFRQGVSELTNILGGGHAQSQHAQQSGADAIRDADGALAGDDLQALVAAYQHGRGAQRELKAATKAVQQALENYRGVLLKWQRASGDFKSTVELHPDDDAQKNADAVDRNIAKLVDLIRMSMQNEGALGKMRSDLREKMGQMRKRLPGDPGGNIKGGGDDDDEDEDGKPKGPQPGEKEGPSRDGSMQQLTLEEAERWLGMLKLDSERKLSLGASDEQTLKPTLRKGRDW